MKLALVAATTFLTFAGIGAAAADDPYPVRNQAEAVDVERDRAGAFNSIQADPFYYGNNRGTRANAGTNPYDRSNDLPQTVIYQQPSSADVEAQATEAPATQQDTLAEAYDRGRADQAREDSRIP